MERKDFIIPLNTPYKFYHSIIDIIDSADRDDQVLCNYFVVRFDHKGKKLLFHLSEAAKRGVLVTLIVDSYGSLHKGDNGTEYNSQPLNLENLKYLENLGINVLVYRHIQTTKFFHPYNLYNWTNYSRRNHNKNFCFNLKSKKEKGIVIGDSQWANEHFNYSFRGNNVLIFSDKIFEKVMEYHKVLISSNQISKPHLQSTSSNWIPNKSLNKKLKLVDYRKSNWFKNARKFTPKTMKFVSNEINFHRPSERKTIQDHEIEIMKDAITDIWYSTPYFCPDKLLSKAFQKNKAKKLKILIAKFRSDPFIPYGTKVAAKKLINSGVNIFEYRGKGNIHYKDLIADDISFIKTANGEGRSRFFNLETGVIIKDERYAQFNKINFQKDLKSAAILTKNTNFIQEAIWAKRITKQLLCPLFYHHL